MNLVELRLKKLGRIKTTKNKMLSNAALMINFHYMSGLKINNKGQKKSQVKERDRSSAHSYHSFSNCVAEYMHVL